MPDPEVERTPLEREWARTTVTAGTPTERVHVTMVGDHDVTVGVDPSWYATTTAAELQAELVRAARLAYVARTRAYYETWSTLTGREVRPVTTPVSPEQEAYARALEDISARGESSGGHVTLSMVGLSHFAVSLSTGVQDALGVREFGEHCREAALACLGDHEQAWQRVHFDVYTRPRLERAGLL